MKTKGLTAQKVTWVLIGLMLLGMAGIIGGSWYLQGILSSKVLETTRTKSLAGQSGENLQKAQLLKSYLARNDDQVKKTALIVADTTFYQYQNQIVEDLTQYANAAGVSIIGFDFPQSISTAIIDKTTGLKSLTATITLKGPTPYQGYLTFLKLIEQNLTKMQITDVALVPDQSNLNMITDPTVGIEVYVK